MDSPKVVVAQLGAREHYRIPRMCHDAGALVRLHTDFWKPIPDRLLPLARHLGGRFAGRAMGRFTTDIPDPLVRSHSVLAAYWNLRLRSVKGRAALYKLHMKWGHLFASRVARDLDALGYNAFFGFSSAALEALRAARKSGAVAVVDEIAPTHLEETIIAEERRAFPGWEPESEPIEPRYLERLEEEWDVADRIMVNSSWTKKALVGCSVPESKIHIVPISFTALQTSGDAKRWRHGSRLRVLWLGTLCLRKGLPYAIEAARRLESAPVQFTFAGPTDVDLNQVDWPSNVTYLGQVPRIEVDKLWDTHQVFMIPTLSDGFAITQVEAIAHGLPVVATPCCGEVVENGKSGLIVEPRNPRAIAEAIERILDGDFDLEAGSRHARRRARDFSPDSIWPMLRQTLCARRLTASGVRCDSREDEQAKCASST